MSGVAHSPKRCISSRLCVLFPKREADLVAWDIEGEREREGGLIYAPKPGFRREFCLMDLGLHPAKGGAPMTRSRA